jgi:hypothetical protein
MPIGTPKRKLEKPWHELFGSMRMMEEAAICCRLMLIGPHVAGWLAGLAGLDEAWVAFCGWLRFPVALFLLSVVLSVVYRFLPDSDRLF